jgi:hypothetical protein
MIRRIRVAVAGLLVAFAAHAADATGCVVHKGLYDSWLSLAKRSPRTLPKVGSLLGTTKPTSGPVPAEEINNEYHTFFECLSEINVPADDEGKRAMCPDVATDRIGSAVCQVTVYLKSNRATATEFLDSLPAARKGADMIWDLETIANAGAPDNRFPALFSPKGPAYKIIDELFVLALDDRDTAMAKYFHIAGAAAGPGAEYTDAQIKVLLRESPVLVVKHWATLRQYQPKLKKLLADLSAQLSAAEMNKLRQGIAGSCTKDNLDCPEILKFFGRPQ